jgi:alkanesulfonate monooxygenase SsuD/methylene tetrahydromethanopterin reductase-like flavin-dependent oxidoreductase (luciferase family)
MPDYGHRLEFGTFITPQNQRPRDVVALAQLSERAGLDLVSFQDHPYQPALLDAWTVLSYVAAKTERVHLAGNVLNLPLRDPAVLARSAASLDLLSDGRVELGLGAGWFWDAIVAMGGPDRSRGGALAALSEAIDIIRAIWDPSERRGVVVDGEHYRVDGAKRGPEPAHDIRIWLGGYRPRMLRLIGEKADGWLPSWPYLQEGERDLARGNALIDEAAEGAGRDPREIRRLLNITPDLASVERLLPLAVEHGVGTFILLADDPRLIAALAGEVAPAVRDAVAAERTRAGTRTGDAVRGPKALALRHDVIDYDATPPSLRLDAVEPGDWGYRHVRSSYARAGSPGLVLRPGSTQEVLEALGFAREQDVPLAIRSGGHGIGGRSTNEGGIVIDLGELNGVEVVEGTRVRLGPGARWGNVARTLSPHGLALGSGDAGDVGVGGLATAGGIGLLGRWSGLTIDHVRAAEVVLADGSVVRTDAETNPELFWGLRGAGGNLGIVTELELEADRLDAVVFSTMTFDARDAASLLERWGELVESAPRELTSFLNVYARSGASPVAQLMNVWAGDDIEGASAALTPLLGVGSLLDQEASVVPYAAVVPASDARQDGGRAEPLISNGLAVDLTRELSDRLATGLESGVTPWVSVRSVGGAVNDVPADATAYAHRHQSFDVGSVGTRPDAFREHWDSLRPMLDGLYTSFETDTRPERLHDAFPGDTLARLRSLKARYDAEGVFDQNFPIPPAERQLVAVPVDTGEG